MKGISMSEITQLKLPFEETEGAQRMRQAAADARIERAKLGVAKASDVTMEDKLIEIARYVVQGCKPGEIAQALGISGQQATKLIKRAKAKGLIDIFHAERNGVIRKMYLRRVEIADTSYKLIQKRLVNALEKEGAKIDSRDVKDAFSALKVTEHTAEEKQTVNTPVVQVGIFSPEAERKADAVSAKILKSAEKI